MATALPAPTSKFVGRARDLQEIGRLFEEHRLVTITGVGGVGKTRLALEAARRLAPEGLFVDLSAVRGDSLVLPAIAQAMGVVEGVDLVRLVSVRLAAAPLLLVDNCEHVLKGAAATILGLLESCPMLRCLATSREALDLQAEAVWPLVPLPEEDAIELFTTRAVSADPGFRAQRELVERLCRRLERLPLAIELAAARAPALTVTQMLDRLDDRFRLLRSSARTAVGRQQTLEATIDWSYQLMSELERVLFGRLAVFEGGFSLEAAEAVCGFEPIPTVDVLQLLSGLVRRSLVIASESGDVKRYGFLETIREFALARLREANEMRLIGERHTDHFARWSIVAREGVMGPHQVSWLHTLDADLGNLRVAADRLRGQDDERELAIFNALGMRAFYGSGIKEALESLERALGTNSDRGRIYVLATLQAAWLYWRLESFDAASRLAEVALEQSQNSAGEPLPWAFTTLARIRLDQGRLEQSRELSQRALAMSLQVGDLLGVRLAHLNLGDVAQRAGDLAAAGQHVEAALAASRQLGTPSGIAGCLIQQGDIERELGNRTRAKALLKEASYVSPGTPHGAQAFPALALLAWEDGDRAGMGSWLTEAVATLRKHRLTSCAGDVLLGWAALAAEVDPVRAVQLGASAEIHQEVALWGWRLPGGWLQAVGKAQARLRKDVALAARAAGSRMTLDQAFDFALAGAEHPAATVLSRRELEVARLISEGLSNRQIARRLYLSERTVEGHVEHAMNKLGFHARSQLATWVAVIALQPEKQVPAIT